MYCKYLNDVLYIGLSICDEVGEVRDSRCCLLQANNIGVIQPRVLNDGLGWGEEGKGEGQGGCALATVSVFLWRVCCKKDS